MARAANAPALFAAALAALAGSAAGELESIDSPAAPGATSPALAAEGATTVDKGHDILLTWLEPGESGGRLRFARFSQGEWTEPVTVADPVATLDPADRPSLTVFDTQAVRRTLIARTGDVVARSGDAGRTWGRLPAAALPFASFAGGDEGGYVFWLAAGGNGDGSARLLGTRVLAGESLLDRRTSGGSSTAAAMTWDGPVVVYRDQGAQGARDIAVVRRHNARWTPARPVHVEGWRPAQRPDSGPQVAALRRQVAVAWYTEAAHRPRLIVAFSSDAGRTFDAPIEVAARERGQGPAPSVAIALDDDGDALVLWLATTAGSEKAALRLARLSPAGRRGEELTLAEELPVRPQDMPQIARAGPRVAVAWIAGDPDRPASRHLRVVAVPLAAVPAADSGGPAPAIAEAPAAPRSDPVGEPVPDLELTSLDGTEVSLPSLRGRAVLLNLWATWCLPCLAEIPELAALHERYAAEGLEMVGLSVDAADAAGRVREFVAEREIPFNIWLDPKMRVYGALRVKALPVTIVVDREGRMIFRRDRAITADDAELRAALRRALDGS